MKKNLISMATGSATLLLTTTVLAVPFGSLDPRSMAMGGAGVAVASPGSAPLFNPALLSIADESDDFAIEIPVIGVRVFDPDSFADAMDEFDDEVMDNLDFAIDNYNSNINSGVVDSTEAVNAVKAVDAEILTLDDKPFALEGGVGMVVSVPGKKFSMAFTASATANFSGIFNYEDTDMVENFTADLSALDDCYALLPDQTAADDCIAARPFNYVDTDPASATFGEVTFTAQSDTGNDSDIQSKIRMVGILQTEVGLSFSREIEMYGTDIAVGLTPKIVSVTVFDYEASADDDDVEEDDVSVDYNDFNLDVGIAMDYKNGWRSGFVIKNIISQNYKAMNTNPDGVQEATGLTVSFKPQARVGVSHTNSWSTVALDIDLTENEGLGLIDDKSRYVALGVEFNAFDMAQLRFGYRADTANSDRSVASAGIGLSPFGVHIDLGVAGSDNEIGASLQLGYRF